MSNKVGSLTIYLNTFKDGEVQPDFRGKMDIGTATYEVSLWINNDVLGFPVNLSGQITEKEDG